MDDVWALLNRVGVAGAQGAFDALADPVATEALASALAERLADHAVDLVVVWEGRDSAILGFAVALRLGVPVTVLSDDEGLVSSATPTRTGSRAALVAPLTPDVAIARMAAGYLESRRIALVATATLLAHADHAAGSIALAALPTESVAAVELPRQDQEQPGGRELRPERGRTGGERDVR